jgi:predicted ATP-dependent endonuclease of OLD family
MHIISLGIENFRIFKDRINLDFRAITLLTGPNNSGKSSAIKALLLLRDTLVKSDSNNSTSRNPIPQRLIFSNESKHSLGSFKDILNNSSSDDSIRITLPFLLAELNGCPLGKLELEYANQNDENHLESARVYLDKELLFSQQAVFSKGILNRYDYKINLGFVLEHVEKDEVIQKSSQSGTRFKVVSNGVRIDLFNIDTGGVSNSSIESIGIAEYTYATEKTESKSFLKLADFWSKDPMLEPNSKVVGAEIETLDEKIFQEIVDHDGIIENLGSYGNPGSIQSVILSNLSKIVDENYNKKDISNYYSLAENSLLGFRSFKPGERPDTIYLELEKYGKLIIGFYDRIMKFNFKEYTKAFQNTHYYPNPDVRFEHLISEQDVMLYRLLGDFLKMKQLEEEYKEMHFSLVHYQFVKDALKFLGVGEDLEIIKVSDYGYEVSIINESKTIRLKDSGFGVRKIISLLLLIASKSKGYSDIDSSDNEVYYQSNTVILEEPESNLHPLLQSKLAEVILFAANRFNTQFIIETHSEYLIRKFQYLTAKNDELKKGDIVIQYFSEKGSDLPPKHIEIGKDGMLSDDFGPGFFDEAINLKLDLMQLKNARKN